MQRNNPPLPKKRRKTSNRKNKQRPHKLADKQTKEQASSLSGEWKPASYVAVTTFVILALALASGTAYDLFNRWVIVSNVNIIKP